MRMSMRSRIVAAATVLACAWLPAVAAPVRADSAANDYGTISGTLTRTVDGSPVVDARVVVRDAVADAYVQTVTSGPDGAFTTSALPPSQYRLVPVAAGLVATGVGYRAVLVEPGVNVTGLNVLLDPATSITGVVRTASGAPIAGARIYALNKARLNAVSVASQGNGWSYAELASLNARAFAAVSVTDWVTPAPGLTFSAADGSFTIDGLQPGPYVIRASAAGRGAPADLTVTVTRASARISVTFPSGGSLHGTANEILQTPAIGLPISLTSGLETIYTNLPPSVTTTTDAYGYYAITGLPKGTYVVTPDKSWSLLENSFSVTINKPSTSLTQDLTVNGLDTLRGTITDNFGTPLPGVVVTASMSTFPNSLTATTDSQGRYEFDGVSADTYDLSVDRAGYFEYSGEFSVTVPSDLTPTVVTQDLQLQRQAWIFGRVLDPAGHAVAFSDVKYAKGSFLDPNVSDADGSFVLTTVSPGWTLVAEAPRYSASQLVTIEQTPSDQKAHLNLREISHAKAPGVPAASAVGGFQSIKVTAAAAADGGNPLTSLVAVASPGGRSCAVVTSCTIKGLNDNTIYRVRVFASNEVGNGVARVLTVRTLPTDKPRNIASRRAGLGAASISFARPKSTIAIVNFRLRYFDHGKWKIYRHRPWTHSPVTVRGLHAGTTYAGTLEALLVKGSATRSPVFYFTTG